MVKYKRLKNIITGSGGDGMDEIKDKVGSGNTSQPAPKKRSPVKRWIRLAVIAVLLILLSITFLSMGNLLMINETPVKSDVIIVLAGDEGKRTDYSIQLFKEGYSDRLLLSGCPDSTGKMLQQAAEAGISTDYIIVDNQSESTYDNAVYSKKLIVEAGYKSAIVVTSDYHMRRSKLVFKKEFKDTDIDLVYCSVNEDGFNPEKWWTNSYSFKLVLSEYVKIAGYFVQGKL